MQPFSSVRRFLTPLSGVQRLFLGYLAFSCSIVLLTSSGAHPFTWFVILFFLMLILWPWILPKYLVQWLAPWQLVGVGCLLLVAYYLRWKQFPDAARATSRFLLACALVVGSTVLLRHTDMPRRTCFWASHWAFEDALDRVPGGGSTADDFLGFYGITDWARDPRGGTYFVTTSLVMFFPSSSTTGFVHGPNSEGTPWGAGELELTRMFGEWYYFRVSNP